MTPYSPRRLAAAKAAFAGVREQLEHRFIAAAGRGGKPAGLRWASVEFLGDPAFAVTADGRLDGFLSVTVRFEPVPGGGMEGVAAATLPRRAAAVFHHRPGPAWLPARLPWSAGAWGTGGRALFNHTAEQAAGRAACRPLAKDRRGRQTAASPTPTAGRRPD